MIDQRYTLNMIPGGAPVRVNVSCYDADSRSIVLDLYSGGAGGGRAFTVPDGAVVTCDGTKADGKGFSVTADYSGSTVTVTVSKQMAVVAGDTRCQLTIHKDGTVLGSANFVLVVEREALGDGTDMSESDYSAIAEMSQAAVASAQSAAADAASAKKDAEKAQAAIDTLDSKKASLDESIADAEGTLEDLDAANGLLLSGRLEDRDAGANYRTKFCIVNGYPCLELAVE